MGFRILLLGLVSLLPLDAQSVTGTIVGAVSDPAGLAVPGAAVTLVQAGTDIERQTTTLENGSFVFASVSPGEYRLAVRRDGFKTRTPLPAAFLRQFVGFNRVNIREWAGSSSYHSMQVTVNRRFARGLQSGGAWTWSKSMDFNSGDFTTVSALAPVRVWNYGLSDSTAPTW
jgi:hypothetical protein